MGGQLSVLDDSFSSFLRTQLNITTAARDRDSVVELTDTTTIRRKKVTTTEVRGRTSSNASEAASKGGRDRPISFADISEGLEGGVEDKSKASANVKIECEIQKLEVPEKPTKD